MGDKNDGGPAFPLETTASGVFFESGMSLRDYFAAAAIPECFSLVRENERADGAAERIARMAYELADAMLAERAK